jgi:hypothetical protein
MKTIIEMAREANVYCTTRQPTLDAMLERFAELVRADERDRATRENAYVLAEREECAKLCDEARAARLAEIIRARGQA